MDPTTATFYVIILIMSVVVHEVAHGFAAERLGDPTAKMAGRLTLNPMKHLDLFGSVLLPFLLVVTHAGFVFGWAKPVPYNPNNLRNYRKGTIMVALAGIIANAVVAIVFSLIFRGLIASGFGNEALLFIISTIIFVNILLAFFNLMPIPPLDGSRVLIALLPPRMRHIEFFLDRYGFIVLLFFIIFLWQYFSPAIFAIFSALTGTQLLLQ